MLPERKDRGKTYFARFISVYNIKTFVTVFLQFNYFFYKT